ncbi:MAG: NADP-dependent malic enzyme [Candidatus Zixiibacteriota bacterium]
MIKREDALEYHSRGRKGKIEVVPTKPCMTQLDLSLAYTPGVAVPCLEIEKNPELAFQYTAKGNLVAVISNGTAVLGLGHIGALAGKPVMEGKGVLFKRFADIDVFDIEIDELDPDKIVEIVKALEPTFGGINLEDIKAPECFHIEERLKAEMKIPVFHDDQHGTAIISGAALLNACELAGKDLNKIKVLFNGAGASGIACANHYVNLGVKLENIVLCDTKGVVYKGRTEGMNKYKERFASATTARTLAQAFEGVDVFCGCSVANVVTKDMVRSMAKNPIIFAMANPDPEITYPDAKSVRDDLIMATGRSDYPNQVNNVLGFPFIFRGALDVRARAINEEMKVAATHALASLTKEPVPESVAAAYGGVELTFGPDYIIPKPFDFRVLLWEAKAVAKAAMETGVAGVQIDLDKYTEQLEARLGRSRAVMRDVINRARREPKRIVLPEGYAPRILRASRVIRDEEIGTPILVGDPEKIKSTAAELSVDINDIEIVNPATSTWTESFVEEYYRLRRRKGATMRDARRLMQDNHYFGLMMVRTGKADGLVAGASMHYPEVLRPALQIFPKASGPERVAGMNMVILKDDILFFADTTVNIDPTAEELADIACTCAREVRRFGMEPKIALLSFSNFGSVRHPFTDKVRRAVSIIKDREPHLIVDGEMQADTAVTPAILAETYPFAKLKERANLLIFPDLQSGNIAYKLIQRLGDAEIIGPLLVGMERPIQVLQVGSYTVRDIVHLAAVTVVEAQGRMRRELFVPKEEISEPEGVHSARR